MRLELRDGQWADLRDRITHGQHKEIRRAILRLAKDPAENAGDGDSIALRVFIRAWSVNDPDGNPIVLSDADAIERMPSDIADEIATQVSELLYPEATVPNAPTPPSSDASSSDRP